MAIAPNQNPFTYGSPISNPQRFVGRQREVEQIFSRLRNPEFENTSVVGERRSGKTSLLNYIGHPAVTRAHGLDPKKYLFVPLDLEMIPADSAPSRLYQFMLRRIAAKVSDDELKAEIRDVSRADSIDNYDLDELFDSIEDAGLHIVLLVDEFETIGNNDNFGPDFYYGLRSLAIHHDLALVTCSRLELASVSRSESVRSSPFFNIFATIRLQPFSLADTQQLLDIYMAESSFRFRPEDVDAALRLSGRMPFFAQMVFHHLYDAYAQQSAGGQPCDLGLLAEQFAEAAAPHLKGYWQHSTPQEKTALLLLTLLSLEGAPKPPDGESGWTAEELETWLVNAGMSLGGLVNRGLAQRENRRYSLASTALRDWISGELAGGVASQPPVDLGDLAMQLRAALPPELASRAERRLLGANARCGDLLAAWLADRRTVEATLELLGQTALFLPQAPEQNDDIVLLGQSVTEAERQRARQLAAMEGTVSIMFTDLEASTELFSRLGDTAAQRVLRQHNQLVREQVARYGGVEVKNTGDGFMLVFSSARRALECAIAIQRHLRQRNARPDAVPLRARIGLNVGEAIKEEQDFFGTAVVVAARVSASGQGGQILVSELFRRVVGSAGEFQFNDLGLRRLKGLPEDQPMRLYEVAWEPAVNPGQIQA